MNKAITIDEILKSAKMYGNENVLTWDPLVYRDNKKNKKAVKGTKVNDCTWLPIKFKYVDGTEAPVKVKFSQVMTSSAAKLPQVDLDAKHLLISFRKVTEEELLVGDLAPKKMETPEDQATQDKKMKDQVSTLYKNTNDFVQALEIINKSYEKIDKDLKKSKSLEFTIRKGGQKNNDALTTFSICQTVRENKEDPNNPIKLDMPLTRIKLPINAKTGYVGIDSYNTTSKVWDFRPNVYDARKMKASNNYTPVLANVKVGGKLVPLDKDNAPMFITYRSIISGVLEFPEIVISKFGISLNNKFKELYVKRNKSKLVETVFSKEDLEKLGNSEEEDDDDAEAELPSITNTFEKIDITANDKTSDLEDNISDENSDLESEVDDE